MCQCVNCKYPHPDQACIAPPFKSPRKVTLPNGIVLTTRWYSPPKIERSELKLNPDVRLPNGIVLRASTYRVPTWVCKWSKHRVAEMDAEYRDLKKFAEKHDLFVCQVPCSVSERLALEKQLIRKAA